MGIPQFRPWNFGLTILAGSAHADVPAAAKTASGTGRSWRRRRAGMVPSEGHRWSGCGEPGVSCPRLYRCADRVVRLGQAGPSTLRPIRYRSFSQTWGSYPRTIAGRPVPAALLLVSGAAPTGTT